MKSFIIKRPWIVNKISNLSYVFHNSGVAQMLAELQTVRLKFTFLLHATVLEQLDKR